MNPLPRQKLQELVARFGTSLAQDARRCEGLLRDHCGAYRREIAVLVSAIEERVPAELLSISSHTPRQVLLAKLAQRLHDNIAMDERAATWGVNSWAFALGVVSSAEIEAMETSTSAAGQPAMSAPQVAPPQQKQNGSTELVVSATGKGDYKSINKALAIALPDAQIRVLPGLYREAVIIHQPVTIIGEGKPQDIIIATAQGSCVLMQATKATVRGLTLRQEGGQGGEGSFAVDVPQGKLRIEACNITSNSLSCVGIHNDLTEVLLQRCRIHSGADSGLYIFNAARATVEECELDNNSNVGVAVTDRATVTLQRSAIHDGRHAGVVAWNQGQAVLEECEVFGNAKAGVGSSEGGEVIIRHSRIYRGNNSGVFIHDRGRGRVEACDIQGHAEPEVVITAGGNLILQGCKIHEGNRAGVFVGNDGKALLEECAVYNNTEAGVSLQSGGIGALRQCHINQNGQSAIQAAAGAELEVKDCDLTGNGNGAWDVEDGALVDQENNQI